MNMVRGGPGGRLRMKRSSIEKEEMSLSYQSIKLLRFGIVGGDGKGEKERDSDLNGEDPA
jgi:hypothetical protein